MAQLFRRTSTRTTSQTNKQTRKKNDDILAVVSTSTVLINGSQQCTNDDTNTILHPGQSHHLPLLQKRRHNHYTRVHHHGSPNENSKFRLLVDRFRPSRRISIILGIIIIIVVATTIFTIWSNISIAFEIQNRKHDRFGTTDEISPPKFQTKFQNAPPCHYPPQTNNDQITNTTSSTNNTNLHPNEIDFTLVLQLSDDRLWMMKHHCHRWGVNHPISVVVYTPRSQEEVLDEMIGVKIGCSLLGHFTDNRGGEDGGLVQVYWHDHDFDENYSYPINHLRNMALTAIPTTHALLIDVDLWPSTTLHRHLTSRTVRDALAGDPKLAIVVPAFQMEGGGCEDSVSIDGGCRGGDSTGSGSSLVDAMPLTAWELIRLWRGNRRGGGGGEGRRKRRRGVVNVFDWTNLGGHGTTRYDRWFEVNRKGSGRGRQLGINDDDELMMDIDCFRSNRYEPYLAFRYCDAVPPFQEQFGGYGKNKVVWVRQLRRMGYVFQQLLGFGITVGSDVGGGDGGGGEGSSSSSGGGGGFLVHYPHSDSKSRKEWNRRPKALSAGTLPGDIVPYDTVGVHEATRGKGGGKGVVDWMLYKRGQVDSLYLDFREWLEEDVVDETRIPICAVKDRIGGVRHHNRSRWDDDVKLWVNQKRVHLRNVERKLYL